MIQHAEQVRSLRALFQRQADDLTARGRAGLAGYIRSHAQTDAAILRQLQAVHMYRDHVHGRTLEWGCHHAPDSCMLKILGVTGLDLHGCDVIQPHTFAVTHEYSGLAYRRLDHWSRLPYDDAFFDTVIADGVLEHVPNDLLSLTEVYRILKPGGRLVICCLPNRYSLSECVSRWTNRPHHLRTYTITETRDLLLHTGFRTLTARYYQVTPTLSGAGSAAWLRSLADRLWAWNPLLERIYPLNRLAANLFLVAEKCQAIQWMPPPRRAA